MITLHPQDYEQIKPFLDTITLENTYPNAIYTRLQKGQIIVDRFPNPQSVIFWHHCGLAYIAGFSDDTSFQLDLINLLLRCHDIYHRNFYLILQPSQDKWIDFLTSYCKQNELLKHSQRYCFTFDASLFDFSSFKLPENFSYVAIAPEHLDDIKGRVIPSYSWEPVTDYFKYGFGYGILDNDTNHIASTAFSSGIGLGKIDIGIETQPSYRRLGLGKLVAAKMVHEILLRKYIPDWGCDTINIGSAAIAKAVGFRQDVICDTFHI